MVNRHVCGTGRGPQVSQTLTPIENQILNLVNPIKIYGDETISMPVTNFEFGDISGKLFLNLNWSIFIIYNCKLCRKLEIIVKHYQ